MALADATSAWLLVLVLRALPLAAIGTSPRGGVVVDVTPPALFNVRDYGARGDGHSLDTVHIQHTIDAAVAAGGGIVVLPAGQSRPSRIPPVYVSSGIVLGSNVVLRIEDGAVLGSSRRWADYKKVLVLATDCDPGPCLEYRRHPIILFSSCSKPVLGPKLRCDQVCRRQHGIPDALLVRSLRAAT